MGNIPHPFLLRNICFALKCGGHLDVFTTNGVTYSFFLSHIWNAEIHSEGLTFTDEGRPQLPRLIWCGCWPERLTPEVPLWYRCNVLLAHSQMHEPFRLLNAIYFNAIFDVVYSHWRDLMALCLLISLRSTSFQSLWYSAEGSSNSKCPEMFEVIPLNSPFHLKKK